MDTEKVLYSRAEFFWTTSLASLTSIANVFEDSFKLDRVSKMLQRAFIFASLVNYHLEPTLTYASRLSCSLLLLSLGVTRSV
jgi:hypothetical protein